VLAVASRRSGQSNCDSRCPIHSMRANMPRLRFLWNMKKSASGRRLPSEAVPRRDRPAWVTTVAKWCDARRAGSRHWHRTLTLLFGLLLSADVE
jgi:hypothetical protein